MNHPSISIAAIGDTNLVSTFSGTPYYFLQAALQKGWPVIGCSMNLEAVNNYRKIWNAKQLLSFQKAGGYQYSTDFAKRILQQIPTEQLSGTVISFNQHFPPADAVVNNGGKLYHYIDATFSQLIDRYEIGKIIGKRIAKETLQREKAYFEAATHIVTMQQWAADSVIHDYGISPNKVTAILPGANIIFPENYVPSVAFKSGVGKSIPLALGFVGKDWERKGLKVIIEAAEILQQQGYLVKINCAGNAPDALLHHPLVQFSGFIDKSKNPQQFIDFLQSCDIGCLFSKAEFSSISVLEFLRACVPVAGYVVDGMGDLYFEDASIRFAPYETAETVASKLQQFIEDDAYRLRLQEGAANRANYVTWERCVTEWQKLLQL